MTSSKLTLPATSGLGFSLLAVLTMDSAASRGLAQGCVAIRGTGMNNMEHFAEPADADLAGGEWLASTGFRWFQSKRSFVGDRELELPDSLQVSNNTFLWDVGIQYAITPRWSVALTIPFAYSTRRSPEENPGMPDNQTSAGGIADIQLNPYVWLWDPSTKPKGNIQIGLGLSAPSGDYAVTDTFYSIDGPVTGYVDQSIQPGTGGWGCVASITAFRELLPHLTGFVNGTYLFYPGDVNDTPTYTGVNRRNPYEQVMSIPDQYFGQGGFMYTVMPQWGLSLGVGARIDGVPAEDVFGESNGFRRPGYAISVEPLLQWVYRRYTLSVGIPVAVYRNRTQSIPEKEFSERLGRNIHGSASFADVSVIANLSASF